MVAELPKIVFYNCRLIPEWDKNGHLSTVKLPVAPSSCTNHKAYIIERVEALLEQSMLSDDDANDLIETTLSLTAYAEEPLANIVNSDQFASLMIEVRQMWDNVDVSVIAQDFEDLQQATMGGKLLDVDSDVLPFLCLDRGYKELVDTYHAETIETYLDKLGQYSDR